MPALNDSRKHFNASLSIKGEERPGGDGRTGYCFPTGEGHSFSRRNFLRMAVAAAFGGPSLLASCARGPSQRAVNFFNWSNYIGKDTLAGFEKETGIKVNYDVYSNEEEMFGKLKAGVQGYDLIVTTDYIIPKLKTLELIVPMPRDQFKNLDNIDKRFRDPAYDPGLAFSVPYLWGTTGIGFNRARVERPPTSWWDLWDAKYKGRLSMLDNARDAIGAALLMLGLPRDTKNPDELRKVRDLLVTQRPLLKQYSSSAYIDDLSSGEIWLAQGWSGDVLQAARENKQVDYAIPKEGSFMYMDSVCLLRGSAGAEALQFVDYLLRPEVAAEIANTVHYATPNAEAKPLLDPSLLDDARVFPAPETQKRLQFYSVLDPEADEQWNQIWQDVKVI